MQLNEEEQLLVITRLHQVQLSSASSCLLYHNEATQSVPALRVLTSKSSQVNCPYFTACETVDTH